MLGLFRRQEEEFSQVSATAGERVHLEVEGRSRINDVVSSARRVPWSLNLLQLLWAAGPVTFLAMQGGYWMGFGHAAPAANFIFFAVFTLLFGLIGLLARFFSDVVGGRRQIQARANLTRSIDMIPDLLFATRDLALAELPLEARRREAAGVLLRELDLGPESVALAIRELTGDTHLGEVAEKIEIYRRLGMLSRVRDLVEASAEQRAAALELVHASTPEVADLLRERLTGVAPSQEYGIARSEQFIEHLLTAAELDDLSLTTLTDVRELLVLAFELVNGRELTQLVFDYAGDWELARAMDQAESTHSEYRLALATASSHVRELAILLANSRLTSLDDEDLRRPLPELLATIRKALRALLASRLTGTLRQRLLGDAVKRLRLARSAAEALDWHHGRYREALARWNGLRDRPETRARRPRTRSQGIRIRERSIGLSDDQKLAVADAFCEYLDELHIRNPGQSLTRGPNAFDADDAKRLAIRLTLILEPYVRLTDPSIQRAVYGNNAPYLGGLQVGMSADAKAGLGAAVVKEVQQDLGRTAERLALQLHRVYHVPLSQSMMDFLVDQYGANRERLEVIATGPIERAAPREASHSAATHTLPALARDTGWTQLLTALEAAQRTPAQPQAKSDQR